jgi:hypothetical protein
MNSRCIVAFFGKQIELLANTRVTYVAPPSFDGLLGG